MKLSEKSFKFFLETIVPHALTGYKGSAVLKSMGNNWLVTKDLLQGK